MSEVIYELIESVLNKSVDLDEFTGEELNAISEALEIMKKSMPGAMPDGGFTMKFEDAGADAGVVKTEVIKFDKCGQWKIEKANTLNYKEMNSPKPQPNPTTIDYSSGTPKISGDQWKTSDIPKKNPTNPKIEAKENRIRQAVKEGKVIDDRKKS